MEKDFTILQISWFTQRVGSLNTVEDIYSRHRALLDFLQQHGLTTRIILPTGAPLTDESRLLRSDLTAEGFEVYRRTEQRWLRSIDRTKRYTDMRLFAKELVKVLATTPA